MPGRNKSADLTLRETAAALGVSMHTVRTYIKAGKLTASKARGKWGEEYRMRPAVVAAFGAEHLHLDLDADALGKGVEPSTGQALSEDMQALYERLVTATAEAERFRAIAQVSESTKAENEERHRAELERLQAERDTAQAELDRLRARGFFARLRRP